MRLPIRMNCTVMHCGSYSNTSIYHSLTTVLSNMILVLVSIVYTGTIRIDIPVHRGSLIKVVSTDSWVARGREKSLTNRLDQD
eukprot:COSAG02_NODE_2077_length_9916_cov_9.422489_7_plen_83_part_00